MKYLKYYLLSLVIIIIDQIVKMLVYYHMSLGEEFRVIDDWFKIHYTLNPGMAFGLQLGSDFGKFALTLFRLVAVTGIGFYLYHLIKKGVPSGLSWCVAMIFGGAIGNLIDSTFYGVLLEGNVPVNAPSPWLHGQVIDMFYIDIWEGRVADWVPVFGGDYLSLWPIFNVADASIFLGVLFILIFQNQFFRGTKKTDDGTEHTTELSGASENVTDESQIH